MTIQFGQADGPVKRSADRVNRPQRVRAQTDSSSAVTDFAFEASWRHSCLRLLHTASLHHCRSRQVVIDDTQPTRPSSPHPPAPRQMSAAPVPVQGSSATSWPSQPSPRKTAAVPTGLPLTPVASPAALAGSDAMMQDLVERFDLYGEWAPEVLLCGNESARGSTGCGTW